MSEYLNKEIPEVLESPLLQPDRLAEQLRPSPWREITRLDMEICSYQGVTLHQRVSGVRFLFRPADLQRVRPYKFFISVCKTAIAMLNLVIAPIFTIASVFMASEPPR